jgi:hypothetical protein
VKWPVVDPESKFSKDEMKEAEKMVHIFPMLGLLLIRLQFELYFKAEQQKTEGLKLNVVGDRVQKNLIRISKLGMFEPQTINEAGGSW